MLTRADELRLGCVHGSSCHMAPSAFVVESSVPSSERVAAIKKLRRAGDCEMKVSTNDCPRAAHDSMPRFFCGA